MRNNSGATGSLTKYNKNVPTMYNTQLLTSRSKSNLCQPPSLSLFCSPPKSAPILQVQCKCDKGLWQAVTIMCTIEKGEHQNRILHSLASGNGICDTHCVLHHRPMQEDTVKLNANFPLKMGVNHNTPTAVQSGPT